MAGTENKLIAQVLILSSLIELVADNNCNLTSLGYLTCILTDKKMLKLQKHDNFQMLQKLQRSGSIERLTRDQWIVDQESVQTPSRPPLFLLTY